MATTTATIQPAFVGWFRSAIKFQKPNFWDEGRVPYFRYFLFILCCGLLSALLHHHLYVEGGAESEALDWTINIAGFVCFCWWIYHDWSGVTADLNNRKLVILEFCMVITNACIIAFFDEPKDSIIVGITAALEMFIDLGLLVSFRKTKGPPKTT